VNFKAKIGTIGSGFAYQRNFKFWMPFSLHGLPAPFQRRFPALLLVIAGYPMQTVMRFSRFDEEL
jgi:hypothetical protein